MSKAEETCAAIMDYITGISGNMFPYDTRIFDYDWDPYEQIVTDYFTVSEDVSTIYTSIHVEASTKTPVFEMSSSAVGEAFVMDNLIDYSSYVEKLIAQQLPVLIYAGEFDAQDGPKTQEYWLRRLNFAGSDDFWRQSRQIYWVDDSSVTTDDGQIVGGYWRESYFFSYLTVPKAGHFVPANYYLPSYQFFSDYISSQKLLCHEKGDNKCSVVSARCDAMNNCHGNGNCDSYTGQCVCEDGWKFADCAVASEPLKDGYVKTFDAKGPIWYSFTYNAPLEGEQKNDTILGLAANNIGVDIYVSRGADSDPNNFSYDMSFRNVTSINLASSDVLPLNGTDGYSVAMYVPAINEGANTLLQS